MFSLIDHHLWRGCNEVVIIYPGEPLFGIMLAYKAIGPLGDASKLVCQDWNSQLPSVNKNRRLQQLPSGILTICFWTWRFIVVFPLTVEIFHSYVSFPKGISPLVWQYFCWLTPTLLLVAKLSEPLLFFGLACLEGETNGLGCPTPWYSPIFQKTYSSLNITPWYIWI